MAHRWRTTTPGSGTTHRERFPDDQGAYVAYSLDDVLTMPLTGSGIHHMQPGHRIATIPIAPHLSDAHCGTVPMPGFTVMYQPMMQQAYPPHASYDRLDMRGSSSSHSLGGPVGMYAYSCGPPVLSQPHMGPGFPQLYPQRSTPFKVEPGMILMESNAHGQYGPLKAERQSTCTPSPTTMLYPPFEGMATDTSTPSPPNVFDDSHHMDAYLLSFMDDFTPKSTMLSPPMYGNITPEVTATPRGKPKTVVRRRSNTMPRPQSLMSFSSLGGEPGSGLQNPASTPSLPRAVQRRNSDTSAMSGVKGVARSLASATKALKPKSLSTLPTMRRNIFGAGDPAKGADSQTANNSSAIVASQHMPASVSIAKQREYVRLATTCRQSVSTVSICYPKTVQRSYGSEKRLFCPPPCVTLSGPIAAVADTLDLCISLGNSDVINPLALDLRSGAGGNPFCVARQMYVPDADKRKSFSLELCIEREDGAKSCVATAPIKAISKPSQKKTTKVTAKLSNEMSIQSGSSVCLFSRLRSQNTSLKFLQLEKSDLMARADKWCSLYIRFANEMTLPAGASSPLNIAYGSDVVLECQGMRSPQVFTILAARKLQVMHTTRDAVSQLNKVVLLRKGSEDEYLGIGENDSVVYLKGSVADDGTISVVDSAVWTILSTDTKVVRFVEPASQAFLPFAPAPGVLEINRLDAPQFEVKGENFSADHLVWLGEKPVHTEWKSSTLLICSLEHSVTDKLTNEIISPPTLVPGSTYRVSISRSADGMVFPTDVGYIHAAIDMGFGMGP